MPLLAVNHHYYRSHSTGRGIYPTTEAQLRGKVSDVLKAGWRFGDQDDIISFNSGKNQAENVCIFTFDDGLKEQLKAITTLEQMGASAICYAPTEPIVKKVVLDVHKLQLIRSVMGDVEIAARLEKIFNFSKYEFDEDVIKIQYRYDDILARKIKYFLNFILDKEKKDNWISDVFRERFGSEKVVCENLYMSLEDLKLPAGKGLLGSHGHSHRPMANLTREELEFELCGTFAFFEEVTGKKPVGVSYPYGGKSAVSESVFAMAQAAGYKYGFSMERGVNVGDSGPYALRRIDTNDLEYWISNCD